MSNAIVLNTNMEKSSEVTLPERFESISSQNLYIYVKSYLASLRANTARVKNRSAVRGGGKKPKAQKGSGGARWGTMRSPLFVGGGQIFGPTKRNYNQKVNKRQRVLALNYALNEHANSETLFVVDSVKIESGKTKDAVAYLSKLNKKDTLFVVSEIDEKTYLAFRNLSNCYMIEANELNAYNVTAYNSIVMEEAVFKNLVKEA